MTIGLLYYWYYNFYRPKIFFPKKSYSMLGEDIFVKKFFKNKTKGFYVDVGAYHPLEGNNTYLLYKKNWNGINIDVNNLSIDLFKRSRKRDLNINIAVSNKEGNFKLYYRRKINMLNTLNKNFAKNHFKNGFKEKKIKTDTLDRILNASKYKNTKIDFLNIDVEGNELNVLKSLNFDIYKPKLICIEIHGKLANSSVYLFLIKKKYKLVWNNKFSYIFKNEVKKKLQ